MLRFEWNNCSVPFASEPTFRHSPVCDSNCNGRLSYSESVEGSRAPARRISHTNRSGTLIDAVKAVGDQLVAANPVEEDLPLTAAAMAGLNLSAISDDDDDTGPDDHPILPVSVGAASRSTLCPPAVPPTSSLGGDSEGKCKSADKSSRSRKLKHDVIEPVNEFIRDMDTCHE